MQEITQFDVILKKIVRDGEDAGYISFDYDSSQLEAVNKVPAQQVLRVFVCVEGNEDAE